jgi:Flp pilus assembly protein TadG
MSKTVRFHSRRGERGITVAFVAVSIFALVGMAALAIDLVTLYVAKSQAQRVADAGALAGAKTLVERGITADPLDTQGSWAATCVQATAQARAIANRGRIGGLAPAVVTPCFSGGGACTAACPASGGVGTGFGANPQVQVAVQSTPLPLFFAKIWGSGTATVRATGYAEGFNPSGTNVPVAAKCVTPWLLPNIDPATGANIFNQGNGVLANDTPSVGNTQGLVGRRIDLVTGCPGGCSGTLNDPTSTAPSTLNYYPLDLPNPAASGPSCSVGASYQQNITSCNPTPIACGQTVDLDLSAGPANVPNNILAIDCLIGAAAPGPLNNGQDTIDVSSFPFEINAGSTHNGVTAGTQVTTSRSVVTIPVYKSVPGSPPATTAVEVIGFVQAFVEFVDPGSGEPTIRILNVSACSASARASGGPAVGLNEASPVPVRLIHP